MAAAEGNKENAAEKHKRICRALEASFEKEENLFAVCRKLKNLVVEKSSQLLLAQQQKAMDEATISCLRANAEKATLEASRLRKKEEATRCAIETLRRQVDELENKLKLRDNALEGLRLQLDKDIEQRPPTLRPATDLSLPSSQTPFQAWKVSSRHITPDTPAASDLFLPPNQSKGSGDLLSTLKTAPRDPYGLSFHRH